MMVHPREAKYRVTGKAEWAGALSWWRNRSPDLHNSGVFFTNSLSIASKSPSKIPDWQSVQEDRIPGARFLEHRKNNEHRFHIWPHLSCFFRSRWSGRLPLARSLFGLRVIPIAPTFVSRDVLRKEVWVTFNLIIMAQSQTSVFLFLCEQAGNKLHGNASHVQIHGQNPLTGAPTHTQSFWDLVNCVPTILVDFLSNFFNILVTTTCWRVPRMRMIFNAHLSSFEPCKPLENLCTAQCFLLKGPLKHFMCFCGRFSEMETKSQADSLFGTVRHHDFARGAWQHLGELKTQAHTTFYGNVYLATDSWRVQLHSPSGRTLNYN